jgi:phosphate transport system protein
METADLSHHISRRFNEDLERVRSKVLGMGGFVEQQLHKAITALVEGDSTLGESVAMDDYQVNNMEVSIDEECSRILATRSPAAGDLRVIVAIIKTITDLERIGDEGEKIGYIASRLATMERPADKYREIKHLGRVVSDMVHDALDAFARMDVESALRVARQDRLNHSSRARCNVGGSCARTYRRSREEHQRIRHIHGPWERYSPHLPGGRGARAERATILGH